jgi:hypothetical protein
MSEILGVLKTVHGTLVYCTSPNDDFMTATSIKFNDGNRNFIPRKFRVGKRYQCFSKNPVAPVIKLEEEVPENFLQQGNKVDFGF